MNQEISAYNMNLDDMDQQICDILAVLINQAFPDADNKVWHGHPVRFLAGNPILGYSKLKDGVRLLFWSGQSFPDGGLTAEGSFKAADIRYTDRSQIDKLQLARLFEHARKIQRDYKNIVKRKGQLLQLTSF